MIELGIYVIAFVAISGIMALIEAAILGVSHAEVDEVVAGGKFGAKALKAVTGKLTRSLVVLVIFTNIVNILGPILVGRKAIQLYGDSSIFPTTLILVGSTIVFSEIIPKSLGSHHAPLISRLASPVIALVSTTLYPVVFILERFAALFKSGERVIGTEVQIRSLAARGRTAGLIESDEGQMIRRVFVLNDRTAASIMTPLEKVISMRESMSVAEASAIVFEHEFSRYPVFGQSSNDVLGIILGRDVLKVLNQAKAPESIQSLVRSSPLVTPDQSADDLLVQFREQRTHMVVVQEANRTLGLVTLEDVLEQLVGEIEDEKDIDRANRRIVNSKRR